MLAHRSIGVILLLLLTKVLELPGQNVAALVSAKRGGGGMARSTEGAYRRGRTSLNMKLDFFYDTATTPQLCTVRLSCAAFSHIQRAILDNWSGKGSICFVAMT